jgi:hypothetical protein
VTITSATAAASTPGVASASRGSRSIVRPRRAPSSASKPVSTRIVRSPSRSSQT